ncbi:GrpB family protein [Paenibacillus harenae]|uniref:GrpB family protein n=1 Tax=Paenibacillus harenae TaxID=306543 RepID=UPI00040ED965|nr:GrpB family protein [Paenibacillus harenae]
MSNQHNPNWPKWAVEAVEIVEHDPKWLEKGELERMQLLRLLSSYGVTEIEHIGSTSVTALAAKPIIDLMAQIATYSDIERIARKLSGSEWHYVPPELDGQPWRRFFVKVKNDKRVAHLHLMLDTEERWGKQLQFRNILREQPNLSKRYAELKEKLAADYKEDREAYTAAKSEFITNVLESGKRS